MRPLTRSISHKVEPKKVILPNVIICNACDGSGNTQLQIFKDKGYRLEKIDCMVCKGEGVRVGKFSKNQP